MRARKTSAEGSKEIWKEEALQNEVSEDEQVAGVFKQFLELCERVEEQSSKEGILKQNIDVKEEWEEERLEEGEDLDKQVKKFVQAQIKDRNLPPYDLVELLCDAPILEHGISFTDR